MEKFFLASYLFSSEFLAMNMMAMMEVIRTKKKEKLVEKQWKESFPTIGIRGKDGIPSQCQKVLDPARFKLPLEEGEDFH